MNIENSTKHHQWGHKNRPDLTGEHKYTDAGQIILIVVFLFVWILDSFVIKYSTFLNNNIKWYFLVIPGVIILAISQYIAVSGVKIVFGEIRETPRVITKGVFSLVRHPVYLGSILAFLGFIVMTLSLLSVIIWLIGIIFYYRVSRYEERLLLSRFGKEYEDYMKKVPMLFPIRF
jgi:protein-S-isoprenylcysteine O-methyltransferase Ste14